MKIILLLVLTTYILTSPAKIGGVDYNVTYNELIAGCSFLILRADGTMEISAISITHDNKYEVVEISHDNYQIGQGLANSQTFDSTAAGDLDKMIKKIHPSVLNPTRTTVIFSKYNINCNIVKQMASAFTSGRRAIKKLYFKK
jgi:hypothetical protein